MYLLVDTVNGLKIVVSNKRNFFNGNYAVQFCGTREECRAEKKRLEALTTD